MVTFSGLIIIPRKSSTTGVERVKIRGKCRYKLVTSYASYLPCIPGWAHLDRSTTHLIGAWPGYETFFKAKEGVTEHIPSLFSLWGYVTILRNIRVRHISQKIFLTIFSIILLGCYTRRTFGKMNDLIVSWEWASNMRPKFIWFFILSKEVHWKPPYTKVTAKT